MEYERIRKPQSNGSGGGGGGGGLSPGKLRNMLMGIDKSRKEEEADVHDFDSSNFNLRSRLADVDDSGGMSSDNCKDVDVVTVLSECSTSKIADGNIIGDSRFKNNSSFISRTASQEDQSQDYESRYDDGVSISSSIFEFQKAERAPQRVPLAPFSKTAPSKWDDAQKWIASPTSNRATGGQVKLQGAHGTGSRKGGLIYAMREASAKVVLEVPDQRVATLGEADTKRIDVSRSSSKENGMTKSVDWEVDSHLPADSYGNPKVMIENSSGETAISFSRHDSVPIHSATTFIPPPSTARSVSMRDMGTEMTPIASQEPSRAGTPAKAMTPTRSPDSSRASTPPRNAPSTSHIESSTNHVDAGQELSQKELQMRTRREIMVLGTQLGKMNIAAWASVEENKDASTSWNPEEDKQPENSAIEARALSWEEAEKAKYMARFKREEMKIQAWENHQKAKTEAEMRKIEVEVEKIRGHAHDKLMNKLAAARHKAGEKRAAAEARRNQQAAKTEHQAEYIRQTGRIPSSFSLCGWCS